MAPWTDFLSTVALCMMRPLGVLLLLPVFTSRSLGGSLVRNALVLLIALPAVPAHLGMSTLQGGDTLALGLLFAREIIIGLMIGFCAALPFWAMDMAGHVVDTMRGSSIASALNPELGEQSSVFGILFSQVLTVFFLLTGGFNTLLSAIYASYIALPPQPSLAFGPGFTNFLGSEWRLMFNLSLSFAMPSMVVMVVADLAFGLLNRSAQQLNVFFIAMPIKSGLVLLVLATGMGFALTGFGARFNDFAAVTQTLTSLLK